MPLKICVTNTFLHKYDSPSQFSAVQYVSIHCYIICYQFAVWDTCCFNFTRKPSVTMVIVTILLYYYCFLKNWYLVSDFVWFYFFLVKQPNRVFKSDIMFHLFIRSFHSSCFRCLIGQEGPMRRLLTFYELTLFCDKSE